MKDGKSEGRTGRYYVDMEGERKREIYWSILMCKVEGREKIGMGEAGGEGERARWGGLCLQEKRKEKENGEKEALRMTWERKELEVKMGLC